jgi:hypothetical protein
VTTLSDPGRRPAPRPIGPLLHEVVTARELLAAARIDGSPELTRYARSKLRDALTVYTAALTERALPVPYSVRDELWLLQHVPW